MIVNLNLDRLVSALLNDPSPLDSVKQPSRVLSERDLAHNGGDTPTSLITLLAIVFGSANAGVAAHCPVVSLP